MDGQSFKESIKINNLKAVSIKKINAKKENENKKEIENLSDKLFRKIYNLKSIQVPEIVNLDNKYYLA